MRLYRDHTLSQALTNSEREGSWLDLQWEVADALAQSPSIAQFGPRVLRALYSALEFQSAVLWKADGDALHRVSEWTAPADGDNAAARTGFAFPVVATTGTVRVVELLSSTPHERDERLKRLLAIIGRQLSTTRPDCARSSHCRRGWS